MEYENHTQLKQITSSCEWSASAVVLIELNMLRFAENIGTSCKNQQELALSCKTLEKRTQLHEAQTLLSKAENLGDPTAFPKLRDGLQKN